MDDHRSGRRGGRPNEQRSKILFYPGQRQPIHCDVHRDWQRKVARSTN
jgi:hypothetical protein